MTLIIIISTSQKYKTSVYGSVCGHYFDTKQRENNYEEAKNKIILRIKVA